jgi:DNA-binding CsgD family transcriptional regulator
VPSLPEAAGGVAALSVMSAMMGDVPNPHSSLRPLVGRTLELEQLATLAGLGHPSGDLGGPGSVLLAGDAGVGKTRLLAELCERATAAGWRVLVGHCLDFGDSALPYLPFSEIVGRLAALPEGPAVLDAHPAVRRLQPGQRLLSGGARPADDLDRAELLEAFHDVLDALAADAPVLVVVEDLHWADQSTRDMVSFLLARSFAGPVSVVASYRSDDLHRRHPLRAAAAEWSRVPAVSRLQLTPLPDGDVRTLVHALHPAPLREGALQDIVTRAEGNAFFVEELVGASELDEPALPGDLADLLLVRLDRVDDDANLVVRAASVAGRRVSHALLAGVVELGPVALDSALRQLVETNVLVPVAADGFAFRHALLAEAVYDDLLPGERVRLHAAYAAALRDGSVDGTAAELARHARAAHDLPVAVRASIRAGDDAMSVGGPGEAARHYELALELLAEPGLELDGEVDLVDLVSRASDAATSAGRPYRALALVQDQLDRLPAATTARDRARLLMALAMVAMVVDTNVNALAATTEALSLVGPDPTPLRARLLSVHARVTMDRQRHEEAVRVATEALELGERLGLSRVVTEASTTLARLEQRTGDPEASRQVLERIVAEARANGHVTEELRSLYSLAYLHFENASFTEAAERFEEAARRGVETGRRWAPFGLDGRMMGALTAYLQGRWDDALELVDVAGQEPPGLAEAALAATGLAVAAGRGDVSALRLLPHLRSWWSRDGYIGVASATAAIDLHGDAGDLEQAVRVHDDAAEALRTIMESPHFLGRIRLAALLVGQLAGAVARTATADREALLATAEPLGTVAEPALAEAARLGRRVGPEALTWVARLEAEMLRLRWLTGIDTPTDDELVDAWERAVDSFTAFGHRFEAARSQARLAAVLRATGQAARARELVRAATATARELGAEPLLAELRAVGGQQPTARSGSARSDTLTAREHEILTLVAQGRSNTEIGRQLFISGKTVSVHVSNILAKLGASGRTEAAALARQRGLLDA